LLATALLAAAGCERGCGLLGEHGTASPNATSAVPRPVIDCPDGLARCEEGTVSVSRLAALPVPCSGPAGSCICPWEALEPCPGPCAAEGAEIVVDRALARAQLCAPGPEAGAMAVPMVGPPATDDGDMPCDEGDRYRCAGGRVVECVTRAPIGRCLRGCFTDGTSIGDDGVSREAAFAILCSR
jgi:hypothetical protein